MAEMDDLNDLLSPLPGYEILTPAMKQSALSMSQIPDSAGVWPTLEGYQATYDIYWAALQLLGFLQAQPVIRQSSSEGTSVAVDAPNWDRLIVFYQSQSKIAAATLNPVLIAVPIPDEPHVRRTDMSGRGDDYGDVDTDVS